MSGLLRCIKAVSHQVGHQALLQGRPTWCCPACVPGWTGLGIDTSAVARRTGSYAIWGEVNNSLAARAEYAIRTRVSAYRSAALPSDN